MDFWTILQMILRVFAVAFAVLLTTIYLAAQVFQKIPKQPFKVRTYDGITWGLAAFCFALGIGSYWGFLAFAPLILWKWSAPLVINRNRLTGSGRWFEVRWQKFTPKGFSHIPQSTWEQVSREVQRLPGDTHLILPRFVGVWAIKFMLKRAHKEKSKLAHGLQGREGEAMTMVDNMANTIIKLLPGRTERLSLAFGVLRITRL